MDLSVADAVGLSVPSCIPKCQRERLYLRVWPSFIPYIVYLRC